MSETNPKAPEDKPADWLELVSKQVESIRFGTVHLIVQDSKVVQIETTEKVRFDHKAAKTPSNNKP